MDIEFTQGSAELLEELRLAGHNLDRLRKLFFGWNISTGCHGALICWMNCATKTTQVMHLSAMIWRYQDSGKTGPYLNELSV
jgi:hypothetical protein